MSIWLIKKSLSVAVVMMISFIFTATIVSGVDASTIDLFDWAFNLDGTAYEGSLISPSGLPSPFDHSSFDWVTGLGTITIDITGAGSHTVISFFDHEIDEPANTFFNEYGAVNNAPSSGQSWEIDEPGYLFGDIYGNMLVGSLDDSNGVPMGLEDDVSMAMGWDFTLGAGESGLISLILSDTIIPSGFYLSHTDPDSDATIYFSSDLTITSVPAVPEPGTILLLGSGLAGMAMMKKKRERK